MTREEAIEHLNTIGQYYSQDHSDPYEECERLTKDELDAIYMAIKALEQKPTIEVLQEIKREIESKQSMDYQRNRKPYNKCLEIVDNRIKEIDHDQ